MKIVVKSKTDETKIGVLDVIEGPFQAGHAIKVYSERQDGADKILYCTGNPGGYVGRVILHEGTFTVGDRLLIKAVHP